MTPVRSLAVMVAALPLLCGTPATAQTPPPAKPEAAPAVLVGPEGAQEVELAQLRPVDVRKIELAVRSLPGEEAAQADLAARADDQVGIGLAGGVQV